MSLTVEIEKTAQRFMKASLKRMRESIKAGNRTIGEEIQASFESTAPKRTGRLSKSFRVRKVRHESVLVVSRRKYVDAQNERTGFIESGLTQAEPRIQQIADKSVRSALKNAVSDAGG